MQTLKLNPKSNRFYSSRTFHLISLKHVLSLQSIKDFTTQSSRNDVDTKYLEMQLLHKQTDKNWKV